MGNPKVDAFLAGVKSWRAELEALRAIALGFEMSEEFKWGWPCYCVKNKNVVLLHGFKDYCALLFFKGALMADPSGILIQQTEDVQSARQIRFTGVADIALRDNALKSYIQNAIEIEKSGAKVVMKKTAEFAMPEELRGRLEADAALNAAFAALTPGRQRAYLLHFADAKQSQTRIARIEKHRPRILAGKGLMDK